MIEFGRKKFCNDCEQSAFHHFNTWLEEVISFNFLPKKLERFLGALLEKSFIFFRLASLREDFTRSDIQLRSTCFINEAKKQGMKFKALRGPFGYMNYFQMQSKGKIFSFEGLPTADFLSKNHPDLADNKDLAKQHLQKGNFPIAQSQAFWFWQKKQALDYGINQLGFPLVVKPRSGSVSRHVTTDIQTIADFKKAVAKSIRYSPAFLVEKFIPNTSVYRATVIDFNFVACVRQEPANVVGNGRSAVHQLIKDKNCDPRRGQPSQKGFSLYKLVINETTDQLLQNQGYNLDSIPPKNKVIYLQKNPFLKLGGDLIEVTPKIHPDNLKLFQETAKFFDTRVAGIDFLAKDISRSWKKQSCAILELNSIPCIEMHHFPSSGKPQNVAGALVDMVSKYYL